MDHTADRNTNIVSFLDYRKVYVHFIYSFAWDVTKKSFDDLWAELVTKGWKKERLHQRYIGFNGRGQQYGAYQPSLLTGGQHFLHTSDSMSDHLDVITPVASSWWKDHNLGKDSTPCKVSIKYYLRILENGAGVCTLTVCLKGSQANFSNIHRVLRLGQNVLLGSSTHSKPQVCSFLQSQKGHTKRCWVNDILKRKMISLTASRERHKRTFTLHELVNRLMLANKERLPSTWAMLGERKEQSLWLDWVTSDWETNRDAEDVEGWRWQSPYIFTMCEVQSRDKKATAGELVRMHQKEVATILCKMNLDNARILTDYKHIGDDYMLSAFPRTYHGDAFANMSHDERLFFSFSRRGALAVTRNTRKIPGYFVLPSCLNLLEILRARWHLGNIVNSELDAAIASAALSDGISPSELLNRLYRWRTFFALFLRDPVPFLFDGGSITEIAERAETEFWLARMRETTYRKFETLDRLVQDLYYRKRVEDVSKWTGRS